MNISVNGYSLLPKLVSKLNSPLLLMTVFAAACSVYDPALIDRLSDAASKDASANGEGGSSRDGGRGDDSGGGSGDDAGHDSEGDSGGDSEGDSGGGTDGDGSVVEDAGFDASACPPGGDASCPLVCPEICDGEDNDCDDEVDEGEQWAFKGTSCAVGVGECQVSGKLICDSSDPFGPLVCDAIPEEATEELCDGLDNNCDSKTDENFPDADSDGIADCVDPDYDGGVVVPYHRKRITINAAFVDETLTDFPVLVNLSGDSELINDTQHDEDIYFTDSDGTALLSFEVESYNRGGGDLIAWVKVPSVSNSADTVFYLYYGDGVDNWDSVNGNDPTGVWDSDYKGVWHLAEDPGPGSAGDIRDSSPASAHATAHSSMDSADLVDAVVGKGIDFDGVDDVLTFTNTFTGTGVHTFSAWVNQRTSANNDVIVSIGSPDTQNQNRWFSSHWDDGFVAGGFFANDRSSGVSVEDAGFKHVAWSYDGSQSTFYVNGAAGTPIDHSGADTVGTGGAIGKGTFDYNSWLNGQLDEIHLQSAARSGAWFKAEFENQKNGSTFLTIETE